MSLGRAINDGKRVLTSSDVAEASHFIGEECYFSDDLDNFEYLDEFSNELNVYDGYSNMYKGKLLGIFDNDSFIVDENDIGSRFSYCLPCEWTHEVKEIVYKPYTVLQFSHDIQTEKLGEFITFRRKSDRLNDIYVLRYNGVFTENKVGYVCLGSKTYSTKELFEEYELKRDNKWQPFGYNQER